MADLLPSLPDTSSAERSPRVVGLDSDDAGDLLGALSSSTARELLAALHDEPLTPSALADRVDTSLQNTQYHLGKLEEADVVEVVDTAYSEKGREMKVYAPTDQPLVVFAGDEEDTSGLRAALSRLLGGIGLVAVASLAVQELVAGGVLPGSDGGDGGPPESGVVDANATTTPTPTATDEGVAAKTPEGGTETATTAADATTTVMGAAADAGQGATDAAAGLEPGLVFFMGGLTALLVGFGYWYLTRA